MKTCVNCNKQVMNEYTECPYCGKPVNKLVKVSTKPLKVPKEKPPVKKTVVKEEKKEAELPKVSENKKLLTYILLGVVSISAMIAIVTSIGPKKEEVISETEARVEEVISEEIEEQEDDIQYTEKVESDETEYVFEDTKDGTVFVIGDSEFYHKKNCSEIGNRSVSEMTTAQAKYYGYEPCEICKPN